MIPKEGTEVFDFPSKKERTKTTELEIHITFITILPGRRKIFRHNVKPGNFQNVKQNYACHYYGGGVNDINLSKSSM